MKQEYIAGGVGAVLGSVGTALQINEILQTISLVLTILGALVSFIIVPLLSWYRIAKKDDGKISEEEFKEGCKHLSEGMQRTREYLEHSQTKDKREEIKKERNRNDG